MGAKRLPKEADMGYFPYSVVYRSKRHAKDNPRADTRNCRCGFEKFTLRPGGVRTTIAIHCGFKIFKMAAKVEKFRRLYALFFNRYNSFLRSFFLLFAVQ